MCFDVFLPYLTGLSKEKSEFLYFGTIEKQTHKHLWKNQPKKGKFLYKNNR